MTFRSQSVHSKSQQDLFQEPMYLKTTRENLKGPITLVVVPTAVPGVRCPGPVLIPTHYSEYFFLLELYLKMSQGTFHSVLQPQRGVRGLYHFKPHCGQTWWEGQWVNLVGHSADKLGGRAIGRACGVLEGVMGAQASKFLMATLPIHPNDIQKPTFHTN